VIVIVFLVILLALLFFAASSGTAATLPIGEILMLIGIFLAFFGSGVYIAVVLSTLALLAGFVFSGRPFWLFMGQVIWAPSSSFVLVAVPLFLLMGEILLRTGLSEQLYKALNVWLRRWPGGLLHTNIASCAVFSAISGSSVATAVTMGSVALPYFDKTNYNQRMVLGSLAAGGALGNLIPPGITFILYGLMTETSVGKLYIAAVVPSIIVCALFFGVIFIHGLRQAPAEKPPKATAREKLRSIVDLLPTSLLILVVLGTIYGGLATPTEAAALGVVAACIFALVGRKLRFKLLHASAETTARNTAMLGLILFGAYMLNYIMVQLRVPQTLATMVAELPLPGWAIMLVIIGFYLAIGTFMEGFAMIITTIPVVFPVVMALGYDPIWFGVVVTMLIEIAMISPPDGTIMYVLQGMRRTPGPITDVFAGVLPFVGVYMLAVLILLIFPQLALFIVPV
jgi:tripartite ATP-independent transporter DctM subunit